MKIENYGVGERCAEAMRLLMEWEHEVDGRGGFPRVVLLPIPTSRDGIHLTGSTELLREVLCEVGERDVVVGYQIPEGETEYIKSRGAHVCDVAEDEGFVRENSKISAIGAIKYLLSEFGLVPSDIPIGIVGYGRIGEQLARILLFLGAKIRIYTSKNATRVELGALGVESRHIDYASPVLEDVGDLRVLINTAPSSLAECFPNGKTPPGLSVIELASGNNFEGVEGVVRLPSIPERFYPKSAGRAYFDAIRRFISEVHPI